MESPCALCAPLPDTYLAQTGYGEYFPENAHKLQKLGFSFSRDLWRCPECGALFDWEDIPQHYGSGNLDEERLTRLNASQSQLIRKRGGATFTLPHPKYLIPNT